MEQLLLRLTHQRPGRLLACAWVTLIVFFPLAHVRLTSGLAAASGLFVIVGYPYLIALGLPSQLIRPAVRFTARLMFAALSVVALVGVVAVPALEGDRVEHLPISSPAGFLIVAAVAMVNIVLFGAFFLATAALNDLRKAVGGQPLFGSVRNFLALYFWLYGGIFYVHRQLRAGLLPADATRDRASEK